MRLVIIALSLALAGSAPLVAAASAQSPVSMQPLAAGEVLLEINALGTVSSRADYATLTVTITAGGETEAGARTATETKIREARAALRALGVADAAIVVRPITTSLNPPPDTFEGGDMAMTMATENTAMAVENAAMDENSMMAMDEVPPSPAASGQAQMEIVIRNVERVAAVQQALSGHGIYAFGGVPVYALNDAAAPRRQARAQAIQKARADAEAYAASLGMRVVRIVRVTERIGLDGLSLFVSEANALARLFSPSLLLGPDIPTMVAVGVDFALAPR
jgi:uncharacterized protein YggE